MIDLIRVEAGQEGVVGSSIIPPLGELIPPFDQGEFCDFLEEMFSKDTEDQLVSIMEGRSESIRNQYFLRMLEIAGDEPLKISSKSALWRLSNSFFSGKEVEDDALALKKCSDIYYEHVDNSLPGLQAFSQDEEVVYSYCEMVLYPEGAILTLMRLNGWPRKLSCEPFVDGVPNAEFVHRYAKYHLEGQDMENRSLAVKVAVFNMWLYGDKMNEEETQDCHNESFILELSPSPRGKYIQKVIWAKKYKRIRFHLSDEEDEDNVDLAAN